MRIATWNINGLRARMDFVLHWLRDRQPDIVGLQELKLNEELFPHLEFEAEGYQAAIHAQKAWNGVAVLSRQESEVVRRGLPEQEKIGARLLSVRVGGLTYITVYVPNGKNTEHSDFPRKLAWLESLHSFLKNTLTLGDPIVLCGDFNLCPTARDTWAEEDRKGSIFHTDAERSAYQDLLDWGLVDLYREIHPEGGSFSWWDYRAGAFHRNWGLRIDLLLATGAVLRRVEDVWIDRDYRKKKDGLIASDHAPVMAELKDD